jgi:hypothetical protein
MRNHFNYTPGPWFADNKCTISFLSNVMGIIIGEVFNIIDG